MFFTQDDYKKIQQWLIKNSVKDTEFNEANIPFNGEETIAIVQGNQNKKVFLKDLIAQVFNLGISDFVNITDKYDAPNISLEEAVRLIPSRARKEGQVITFLDREDHWHIYQFKGVLNQWNVLDTWEDLFDWEKLIIDSILPDEEDLTKSLPDENGNSYLSLKDREYNPEDFSGLGRVILRKNIIEFEDPIYGKVKKNVLTQDMINKPNTIYEIRYDFDLNGEEITIPEDCVLDFQGGSFDNGTIIGKNTIINASITHIFKSNIICKGIWKCTNIYSEWFGAKGDGKTNDSNAFTKVSSIISSGTSFTILNKIYAIDGVIRFSELNNININCFGKLIAQDNKDTGYGLMSLNNCTNIKVNGLHIDGNADNVPPATRAGEQCLLAITHCNNIIFSNLILENAVACGCCGGDNDNIKFINTSLTNIGEHGFYFGASGCVNIHWDGLEIENIGQADFNTLRGVAGIQFRAHSSEDRFSRNILIENVKIIDNGDWTESGKYSQHRYLFSGGHVKNFIIKNGYIEGKSLHILNVDATNDSGIVQGVTFKGRSNGFRGDKHQYSEQQPIITEEEFGNNKIVFNNCYLSGIEELTIFNYDYENCIIDAPSLIGGSYVWYPRVCKIFNSVINLGGWRIDYQNAVTKLEIYNSKINCEGATIISCHKDADISIDNIEIIAPNRPTLTKAYNDIDINIKLQISNSTLPVDLSLPNLLILNNCDYIPSSGANFINRTDGIYNNVRINNSRAEYKILSLMSHAGSQGQKVDFRFGYIRKPKVEDYIIITNPVNAVYTASLEGDILRMTKEDINTPVNFIVLVNMG